MPSGLDGRRVVIIGAGPTGLGAAYRLAELAHTNVAVYERHAYPGGLAASFRDPQGFTWDVGGHVQFSHYEYFDRAMDATMGADWLTHEREAWVWMRERFVPYPFQYNTHLLPDGDRRACLVGLLRRSGLPGAPSDFEQWIRASFGDGIAEAFMLPYNFKVWAYPPATLDFNWIGERVAKVDLERVVLNFLDDKPDTSWGPNNAFRFPSSGGTGEIWRRLAAALPPGTIHYGRDVQRIDTTERTITLSDGTTASYDVLISTMPLDTLLERCGDTQLSPAHALRHSTVHVVGIGLRGAPPAHLAKKCWIYYPEGNCPFYRLTVFSNYAAANVPKPEEQWSVMVEVSESPMKAVDRSRIVEDVLDGLVNTRVVSARSQVVSCWHHVAEHGYPTPFVGRDQLVDPLLDALAQRAIFSRGRFGAWKYEVSNQDHSFMQGVEVVDHVAFGSDEVTLHQPSVVNAARR